jgi:hypothetical protein
MRRDDDELEPILDGDMDEQGPLPVDERPSRGGPRWRLVVGAVVAAVALVGAGATGGHWLVRDGDRSSVGSGRVATEVDREEAAVPTTTAPRAVEAAGGWIGGGGFMPMYGPAGPPGSLQAIGSRTTAQGVTIRSYRPKQDEQAPTCAEQDWCQPVECQSQMGLVHAMSTDAAIGTVVSQRRPVVVAPPMYVSSWGIFGVAESAPVLYATVVVADGPATVGVSLDGITDAVGLTGDEAVLAVPVSTRRLTDTVRVGDDGGVAPDFEFADVAVVARDHRGREIGRAPLFVEGEGAGQPLPSHCEQPAPPLPPPGQEQPADPAWALDQIRRAYTQFWSSGLPRAEKLDWLTDPLGVEDAMARAAENYPQATASTTVEVGDIVFLSRVQAQLHFRLVYKGAPSLGHRTGQAAYVDGRWKVTRATACELLSTAGASCTTG